MKRLAALTLAVAALATACGSDDDGDATVSDTTQSESTADFNDADVTFAQGMIPHHQQAVEMAQLAEERAESEEVKDLASRIEAAQDPEIQTMTGWLEAWGEPVEAEHDMSGDMDMGAGMMSDDDMSALEDAEGAEFDEQFLEMMAEHHRGAVEMAEVEIAEGAHPDAVALAEDIVEAQTAEIEEIETILSELGG